MAFYYNPHHGAASTSHEVMSPAYVLRADCANYPTWSIRMKLMLCQKEVWGVVGGGISVESDGFSIKDEKAKGLIGALVDEMLMHVVADAGSSKEAWERLEGMSKSAAPTYERELRRNLANFGEHAGKAVGELLGLMTMLRRELGALGVELSEPEYVHALFEALPDDFAAAEQAWIAGGGVAGIESIQSMLLAIERQVGRRKGAAIGGAHERSLFAGQTDAQRSNVRRAKFDGSCWDCGKSGHTRRNCTRRARGNATATEEEGGTKSNEIAMFALNTVKRSYADAVRGGKRLWILDSGASAHMTGCVQLLSNVRPCNHKIRTANNGEMEATAAGCAQVEGLHLRNVLYVPGLALDLISIPKLAAEGATVMFEEGKCLVEDKGETTVSTLRDGLYALSAKDHSPMSAGGISSQLLHERLCHPYDRSLPCEICILAKSTRRSFPPNDSRASVPLEVLHSDVLEVTPRGAKGERYLVTLVDDATGLSACTPIHRKSQTGAVLMAMVSMMETACKQQTKTLRTDRGTEYMNSAVREWAAARDISLRPSPAYVPEMNGRAERFNRTLLEKVRAVVLAKNISKDLWPELAPAVCYVLNRSMNSRGQIPIAVACGESSSTEHLRVLGSPAYVFEPGPEKLDARAQKGVLVGYGKRHKVYRILLNGSVREVTNVRIQEKERFAETMVGPPGIDILSDESEPLHEETNGNQTSQIEEGPHTVEREDVEPATKEWTFEEDLSLASVLHALGWGEWNRIVARDELRGRSAIDAERRAEVLGITHDNAAEILNDLFPGQSALVAELITDKITLNSKAASQAVKRELDAVMSMHVFDPKKVVEFREASTDPSAQFVRGKMIVARKNVEQDTSQQLLKARLVAQGCVLFNGSGYLVRDDDFQYERPIGLRSSRYVLAHGRAAGDLAKFDVDSAYLSADLRGPRTYLELPESVRPDAWVSRE